MTDRQPVLTLQVTITGDDSDHSNLKALMGHLKHQIKTLEGFSKDRDFAVTHKFSLSDLDDQTFAD